MSASIPAKTMSMDEVAEQAFWEFDARAKGYRQWYGAPQSTRDAFKAVIINAIAEATKSERAACEWIANEVGDKKDGGHSLGYRSAGWEIAELIKGRGAHGA